MRARCHQLGRQPNEQCGARLSKDGLLLSHREEEASAEQVPSDTGAEDDAGYRKGRHFHPERLYILTETLNYFPGWSGLIFSFFYSAAFVIGLVWKSQNSVKEPKKKKPHFLCKAGTQGE